VAKTATPQPRKRKAGGSAASTKAPRSVTASFLKIHEDLSSLRSELARDRRQSRADNQALEGRVTHLENADGMRNKTLIELGISVNNIQASIDAIHALIQGLSEVSRADRGHHRGEGPETKALSEVQEGVRWIKERLEGGAPA